MIVPAANTLDLNLVASAASDMVGKEPDYEVWGPSESVTNVVRYVTHMPRDFQIVDGIRFSSSFKGSSALSLNVSVNGVNLFSGNQTINQETQLVPLSAVIPAYQASIIPAGARILLTVSSAPVTASGTTAWAGLRMAFLGRTPGVSAVNAGLSLPPLALWTPTLFVDPVLGAGGVPLPGGSTLAYWPDRGTVLTVHNPTNVITELTTAGLYVRTITLEGFNDVEAITHMDGIDFAVVEESLKTIVHIQIPLAGSPTITKGGANWVKTIETGIPIQTGLGLESLVYDPVLDVFFVTTEKTSTVDPTGPWGLWKQTNEEESSGSILFDLKSVVAGVATDISDISLTAARTFLMASHEGASADDNQGRLLEVSFDGRLIQQTNVPRFVKLEGVCLNPRNDRIFMAGEIDPPEEITQFSVWSRT